MTNENQHDHQGIIPTKPTAASESDASTSEAVGALRDLMRLLARGIADRWTAALKAKHDPVDLVDDQTSGDIQSTDNLSNR